MKVPNFVSKLSNQGALIHVLPHIHVEMLGNVEEFFLRFAIKAAEPSGSTEGWITAFDAQSLYAILLQ